MLHSTKPSEPTNGPTMHITLTERNVLRYIAGYICRQLRKKIKRTNHKLKEELILCLVDMTKDRDMEDHGTDEEWTDLIDRGGLTPCTCKGHSAPVDLVDLCHRNRNAKPFKCTHQFLLLRHNNHNYTRGIS